MTTHAKGWWLAAIAAVLVIGAAAYGITAWVDYQARASAPSEVKTATTDAAGAGERIVFRNTGSGNGYGLVASVPLTDPAGARTISDLACDRVYATTANLMCLHIDRGVVTTFNSTLFDAKGTTQLAAWPLPGVPSRTRISADSHLVAATAFITGESYASVGFSTQTTISTTDGTDYGSLEEFALSVDGAPVTAADRNIWGVTFSSDDNVFYATASSAGRTWLVRGDLAARTLTAIKDTAECPSLSADGTHIAYKKNQATTGAAFWSIAVLDFATGKEVILPEKNSVDDQVEWLDDGTLLYGMPRAGAIGDYDVWSVPADGSGSPRLFIEHAWSPSVVR